ncbi:glutamine synthetase, partial [Elysia marginata]
KDGTVPFNNTAPSYYGRIDSWAGHEEMFFDISRSLVEAGLPLESLLTEMAPGQFEITFAPQRGVASPDSVVVAKEALRKCLGKASMMPTFMSTPNEKEHSNGFHFNHSLWKINDNSQGNQGSANIDSHGTNDDGNLELKSTNSFYDPTDAILLSPTARHWIAGLVKHAPGLALLSSPTINCTRRLQDELSPKGANWGVENRAAFLRVRNSKCNVYIEDRLPSSASNPYLVVAGVVAAGMDGIRKKLECPPPMDQSAPPLPTTLDDAVYCLEKDTVLIEALGKDLVSTFLSLTRKAIEKNESGDLEDIDRQRKIYFTCI